MFALERQHLKPVNSKINTIKTTTNSIARTVRKDNTVIYLSNRYSLPLGTYKSNDRQVHLTIAEDNLMVITDSITHPAITTAILDRLLHKSEVINLDGDSYRLTNRQTIFGSN